MFRELLESDHVTEVARLRGRIGMMAFHGGNLERTTDVVASEVARRTNSSFYAVIQSAPLRRHLPSAAFVPEHSHALAAFLDHVDVAIAIHGYGRKALRSQLLLGGRNRALARHVASFLARGLPSRYEIVAELDAIPRELRGQHRDNPVNRPRDAGLQIELPATIRWNRDEKNWSDHEGTGRAVDVDHLIAALADAVDAWGEKELANPADSLCGVG